MCCSVKWRSCSCSCSCTLTHPWAASGTPWAERALTRRYHRRGDEKGGREGYLAGFHCLFSLVFLYFTALRDDDYVSDKGFRRSKRLQAEPSTESRWEKWNFLQDADPDELNVYPEVG